MKQLFTVVRANLVDNGGVLLASALASNFPIFISESHDGTTRDFPMNLADNETGLHPHGLCCLIAALLMFHALHGLYV